MNLDEVSSFVHSRQHSLYNNPPAHHYHVNTPIHSTSHSKSQMYAQPCSTFHDGRTSSRLRTPSTVSEVIATARGTFGAEGGSLVSAETNVSIIIPPGAIEEGMTQEIYFKVYQDKGLAPPLDEEKGETLLSPIVMCGPHGLRFKVPIELRLPHCASVNPDSWSFALKSSDTNNGKHSFEYTFHSINDSYIQGEPAGWRNITLDNEQSSSQPTDGNNNSINEQFVSVLVDHF